MLYVLLKSVAKFLIHIKFLIEVIGSEHIQQHHNDLIVAANHVSNFDPIILSCTFKRNIHFMAEKELFRSRFSAWLMTALHTIPVDIGTVASSYALYVKR